MGQGEVKGTAYPNRTKRYVPGYPQYTCPADTVK
jgi:hypothetical protein